MLKINRIIKLKCNKNNKIKINNIFYNKFINIRLFSVGNNLKLIEDNNYYDVNGKLINQNDNSKPYKIKNYFKIDLIYQILIKHYLYFQKRKIRKERKLVYVVVFHKVILHG